MSEQQDGLPVSRHEHSQDVPVFNCLVYIARDAGGQVRARVANLAGLTFTGENERAVLAQVVPAFKQMVVSALNERGEIQWIDPPLPRAADEQERLIPVHL